MDRRTVPISQRPLICQARPLGQYAYEPPAKEYPASQEEPDGNPKPERDANEILYGKKGSKKDNKQKEIKTQPKVETPPVETPPPPDSPNEPETIRVEI